MPINKFQTLILISLVISGCQKSDNQKETSSKSQYSVQSIWNEMPLGNQIIFFDKKYNLTPREIDTYSDGERRVYEFSSIKNCDLTLLVSKKNKKIYQISADEPCGIKDDGHGVSPPYDSKTKFNDLVKNINTQDPPLFDADCLQCGNAYEPMYYMTFEGAHFNGFIDVIYTFSSNEGISKWAMKIIENNGGYGSEIVDENKVNYAKYRSLAIQLWSNEKPNSITYRALGYKE